MSLNTVNSLIQVKYGLKMQNSCCENYKIPRNISAKINSNDTYKKSKYYIQTVLWPEDECDDDNDDLFFLEGEHILIN